MTDPEYELHILQVGQSLNPNRELWPEGGHYNFPGGEHELALYYGSPQATEIAAVRLGIVHFGFVVIDPLIFLCFKIGPMPWADAPFNWHRMDPDHRVLPRIELEPKERAVIRIILADTNRRGRIEALRMMTFSPAFTQRLHNAMVQQAMQPAPSPEESQATVMSTYQRYTSEQLARHCRWRCKGGD